MHALYELIERDAISRLCAEGRIRLDPQSCRCVDLDTLVEGPVKDLISALVKVDITLKLIWVKSSIAVHTFWAVLLDRTPLAHCSTVNVGYGTHLSPEVAATRAITEAAQSRLTFIHGAREDLHEQTCTSRPTVRIARRRRCLPFSTGSKALPIGEASRTGPRSICARTTSMSSTLLPMPDIAKSIV